MLGHVDQASIAPSSDRHPRPHGRAGSFVASRDRGRPHPAWPHPQPLEADPAFAESRPMPPAIERAHPARRRVIEVDALTRRRDRRRARRPASTSRRALHRPTDRPARRTATAARVPAGPRPPGPSRRDRARSPTSAVGTAPHKLARRWTPTPRQARSDDPLRPGRGRGADLRRLARGAATSTRSRRDAGGELLDRDPAAERDRRRCTWATRSTARSRTRWSACSRMRGRNTLWILGTDHAGIATQSVVEKELRARGHRPPRARPRGVRRAGLGVEGAVRRADRRAVQAARRLLRLRARALHPRRGLRARRLPRLQAALRQGLHLPRQLHGQLGPGLALGDLRPRGREPRGRGHALLDRLPGRGLRPRADRRHGAARRRCWPTPRSPSTPTTSATRDLVGEHCVLPLVGRRLPIIADEHVDPEFGTGALKITPGHDPNDFEIGRKHGLEEIARDRRGRPDDRGGRRALRRADRRRGAGGGRRGAARGGPCSRAEEPYVHSVPFSHRSGERIEPLISLQWFCRMDELAEPAIEVVERDEVRIAPDAAGSASTSTGCEEIRPWCISRQLWWGHRLPVWYCDACEETYRRRGAARALRRLRRRAAPGGGRARHLVQLGALAVRDARLARRHARAARLLPDRASSPPRARSSSSGSRG